MKVARTVWEGGKDRGSNIRVLPIFIFLHGPTGVETVLMFIIIAFNLMQLYFFKCIRSFRKKRMLQIDIIEDIRDERFIIEDSWDNPLFMKT